MLTSSVDSTPSYYFMHLTMIHDEQDTFETQLDIRQASENKYVMGNQKSKIEEFSWQ